MGLFNLLTGNTNNNNDGGDNSQPIILKLNNDSHSVSPADVNGRSIAQLFADYLGADTSRINRFFNSGSVVNAGDTPQAGRVYTAAVTTEAKG